MPKQKASESLSAGITDSKLRPAVAQLGIPLPGERRNIAGREALLRRIRGEFEETRGLSLTVEQAATLFGVNREAGERIFQGMFEAQVLDMTPDRHYVLREH